MAQSCPVAGLGMDAAESWGSDTTASAGINRCTSPCTLCRGGLRDGFGFLILTCSERWLAVQLRARVHVQNCDSFNLKTCHGCMS